MNTWSHANKLVSAGLLFVFSGANALASESLFHFAVHAALLAVAVFTVVSRRASLVFGILASVFLGFSMFHAFLWVAELQLECDCRRVLPLPDVGYAAGTLILGAGNLASLYRLQPGAERHFRLLARVSFGLVFVAVATYAVTTIR